MVLNVCFFLAFFEQNINPIILPFFISAMNWRSNWKMNAIIFGPPGSGKGTYASRLQSRLGLDVIATGDIFREILKQDTRIGRKVKCYVERGLLVPNYIVLDILKKRINDIPKAKGLILDGYPRNIEQADVLEKFFKIDVILLQMVPDWIIIERLSSRRICKGCGKVYNVRFLKPKIDNVCDKCGESLYQRSDDNAEVVKKRIQIYQEQTNPILQRYKEKEVPFIMSSINKTDTPPEPVVEEIIKKLKKLKLV
jgi:adenylate kinase